MDPTYVQLVRDFLVKYCENYSDAVGWLGLVPYKASPVWEINSNWNKVVSVLSTQKIFKRSIACIFKPLNLPIVMRAFTPLVLSGHLYLINRIISRDSTMYRNSVWPFLFLAFIQFLFGIGPVWKYVHKALHLQCIFNHNYTFQVYSTSLTANIQTFYHCTELQNHQFDFRRDAISPI